MEKAKSKTISIATVLLTVLLSVVPVFVLNATPSTVFWTPCTVYFQPFMKGHIGYDSYVRDNSMLSNDYGFTVGVLPFKEIQAEVGYDALLPVASPATFKDANYFNAKIGWNEGALLPVGFSLGVFNVGIDNNVTNYDVYYAAIGKTFDNIGTVCVGAYSGNDKLLIDDNGKVDTSGLMASYVSPQVGKFQVCADYMGGNNALSAWGAGLYYYFADNADLLTGPVFPLSKQFAGSSKMMWSLQLDVDFDMVPPPPAAKS
jgi:hypothetical protein